MSKIEDALRKLQKSQLQATQTSEKRSRFNRPSPQAVIPMARPFDGEHHHLDEKELIRGGLLAPPEQALPIADEFRRIKRPLLENMSKFESASADHMNLILVTSAYAGVGKTFCSVNLAASMALERERNVLLIDADVVKPHISKAFGLEGRPGLIDLLEDETLTVRDVVVRTDLNEIQVLPAGREHLQSTELLSSARMEQLMDEIATRYPDRIVVIDSPPLLMTSEAQALAMQAGQIVLVIECGKSGHHEINEVLELLDRSKAINVVMNKNIYAQPGGYYGGYNSYGFNEPDQG